ncbi:hypothetical protein JCM6882_004242 [Rhodosporidiobolus microsporus]
MATKSGAAGRASSVLADSVSVLQNAPHPAMDPHGWNDYWEAHWKKTLDAFAKTRLNFFAAHARSMGAARSTATLSDSSLFELVEWRSYLSRDIFAMYQALMKDGTVSLISEMWMALTREQRKTCALQSLALADITCSSASGRMYTPELTLDYLASDFGFPGMLDYMFESGSRFKGKDYLEIVCPAWDKIVGVSRASNSTQPTRAVQFERAAVMNERNRFLYHVILAMCESIAEVADKTKRFNHDQPRYYVQKPSLPGWPTTYRPEDPHVGNRAASFGGLKPGAIDSISQKMMDALKIEEAAAHPELCHGCCRKVAQIPEFVGTKKGFMYCGRCLKLDPVRKVPYCSADCQAVHYKAMHKKFCGKHYADVLETPSFLPPGPRPPPCTALRQLDHMRASFPTLYLLQFTPPGTRVNTFKISPIKLRREAGMSDEQYRARWELLRDGLDKAVESFRLPLAGPNKTVKPNIDKLAWFAAAVVVHGVLEQGADHVQIFDQARRDFRIAEQEELLMAVEAAMRDYDFERMKPW